MKDQELYDMGVEAMQKSYSPYSKYKVGAAVLTKCGKVFKGCNVENSSYGATICGERTAIVKAVSEGYRDFEAIAVCGSDDVPSFPCGICRQFIFEFGSDIRIIMLDENKQMITYKISELLPKGFRL